MTRPQAEPVDHARTQAVLSALWVEHDAVGSFLDPNSVVDANALLAAHDWVRDLLAELFPLSPPGVIPPAPGGDHPPATPPAGGDPAAACPAPVCAAAEVVPNDEQNLG